MYATGWLPVVGWLAGCPTSRLAGSAHHASNFLKKTNHISKTSGSKVIFPGSFGTTPPKRPFWKQEMNRKGRFERWRDTHLIKTHAFRAADRLMIPSCWAPCRCPMLLWTMGHLDVNQPDASALTDEHHEEGHVILKTSEEARFNKQQDIPLCKSHTNMIHLIDTILKRFWWGSGMVKFNAGKTKISKKGGDLNYFLSSPL